MDIPTIVVVFIVLTACGIAGIVLYALGRARGRSAVSVQGRMEGGREIIELGDLAAACWLRPREGAAPAAEAGAAAPAPAPRAEAPPAPPAPAACEAAPAEPAGPPPAGPGAPDAPVPQPGPPAEPPARFADPEIEAYWRERILTRRRGFLEQPARLRTAEALLELLDRYGGVPSVYSAPQPGVTDPNMDLMQVRLGPARTLYDVMALVSLRRHALNVARRIEDYDPASPQAPILILEALAHDVGKIRPAARGRLYATGDHPVLSVAVLKTMVDGFTELPEKDRLDIEAAVLHHHRDPRDLRGADYMHLQLLKRADRETREAEMNELLRQMAAEGAPAEGAEAARAFFAPPKPREPEAAPPAGPPPDRDDSMDMSWVDVGEFFRRLLDHVNVIEGGRYSAVSTPEGVVYVWTDRVRETLNALAAERGAADVLSCEANPEGRRRKVRSLLKRLRGEGHIHTGLIREGFVGAPFLVRHAGGGVDEMYAVPFHAEAFGVPVGELEARKSAAVLRDITAVEPDTRKGRRRSDRRPQEEVAHG